MIWVLTFCTEAWLLCGQLETLEYNNKIDCYEARELLLSEHERGYFKYVTCSPLKRVENNE